MKSFCLIFGFFLLTSTNFSYGKRHPRVRCSYEADEDLYIDDVYGDDDEGFACEDSEESSDDDESFACEDSEDGSYDDEGFACESSSDDSYDDEGMGCESSDDDYYEDDYDGYGCSESDDDDYSAFSCSEYESSETNDWKQVSECRSRPETSRESICLNDCDCDFEDCNNENNDYVDNACLEELTACYNRCD
ncbi:MAG: hypothetical protein GY854_35420 [Deltaproteobacteria bacterium]|nr:hypothetical protein [Deltaproteobacteria bacterium]